MARPGGYQFQPWHALAIGGAVLGYALLSRLGKGGPSLSFPGPAEGFASYESEYECDPRERRGTSAFRSFIRRNFGGTDMGIIRDCGASENPSGHYAGKAWDWGVDGANVPAALDYLLANNAEIFRRAGLTYMIYNQRIWNAWTRAWQNYTGADPHTSHVHFSFSTPGSLGQTSLYRAIA